MPDPHSMGLAPKNKDMPGMINTTDDQSKVLQSQFTLVAWRTSHVVVYHSTVLSLSEL